MKLSKLFVALSAAAVISSLSLPASAADAVLSVATDKGTLSGVVGNGGKTAAWLGVPYATSPVGSLRWKAPQPLKPWAGEKKADKLGPYALQISKGKAKGTEDCLTLNVWRPNTDERNLPVMVFLHGGNNQTGNSAAASNGEKLAVAANAIVVGLNYRLGPLGFVELPALKTGSAEENSGNFTLLDINAGLDWVRANIARFGGNPANITLAGHSAGGRNVMAILTSPLFKGKFAKAMSLSGSQTISSPAWSEAIQVKAFAKLALEDGRAKTMDEAVAWLTKPAAQASDVREWLYSLPADRIVALMSGAKIRMGVFPHLFADGTVLPKEGMKVYDSAETAKHVSDVPVLLLGDQSEFKFYAVQDPYFKSWVKDGSVMKDPVKKAQYRYASYYGSQLFGVYSNTQKSAERLSGHMKSPVYSAIFRWGDNPAVMGERAAFLHGSKHGVHMDFLFSQKKFNLRNEAPEAYETKGAAELSKLLQRYVKNYLWTSDPNGKGLAKWYAWNPKAGHTQFVFDADKDKAWAVMTGDRVDLKKLWSEIRADKTVSEEAKTVLNKKVMNGRFWSSEFDKEFGNPATIMP